MHHCAACAEHLIPDPELISTPAMDARHSQTTSTSFFQWCTSFAREMRNIFRLGFGFVKFVKSNEAPVKQAVKDTVDATSAGLHTNSHIVCESVQWNDA